MGAPSPNNTPLAFGFACGAHTVPVHANMLQALPCKSTSPFHSPLNSCRPTPGCRKSNPRQVAVGGPTAPEWYSMGLAGFEWAEDHNRSQNSCNGRMAGQYMPQPACCLLQEEQSKARSRR
eukprot:4774730-Prymnesium_polylepis.1